MKCAICNRPGIWSQRFGAILCNACKRRLERANLKTFQRPLTARAKYGTIRCTQVYGGLT